MPIPGQRYIGAPEGEEDDEYEMDMQEEGSNLDESQSQPDTKEWIHQQMLKLAYMNRQSNTKAWDEQLKKIISATRREHFEMCDQQFYIPPNRLGVVNMPKRSNREPQPPTRDPSPPPLEWDTVMPTDVPPAYDPSDDKGLAYKGEVRRVQIKQDPDMEPPKRVRIKMPEGTQDNSYPIILMVERDARVLLISMTTRPASE